MNVSSTLGRFAGTAVAVATAFLLPAAALAQAAPPDDTIGTGALFVWGGILVGGGALSAGAMVAVARQLGSRGR